MPNPLEGSSKVVDSSTRPAARSDEDLDVVTKEIIGCPVASTFRADQYAQVQHLLRHKDVVQLPDVFTENYREKNVEGDINAREYFDDILFAINGSRNRRRRKLLNSLVRPANLDRIREEVVIPAASKHMAACIREVDGCYEADLVVLLDRIFLEFAANLIGLVGTDTEEGLTALQNCVNPIFAGILSKFFADRAEATQRGLEAKNAYVEDFYRPSLAAHQELLRKVERGEMSEEDVPNHLIHLIATAADPDYVDEGTAIRESILIFNAAVGTSTQALVWVSHMIAQHLTEHPEDLPLRADREFLLRCLEEAVRLKAPFVAYQTRVAIDDIEVGGKVVHKGEEIRNMLPLASRDPAVFGPDSSEFNPRRPDPDVGLRYGLAFGTGPHQCLGLRIVLGNDGRGGSHLSLLQILAEAGMGPDDAQEPQTLDLRMGADSVDDLQTFLSYPVVFDNWTPPTT
jgi:cytochrome P450